MTGPIALRDSGRARAEVLEEHAGLVRKARVHLGPLDGPQVSLFRRGDPVGLATPVDQRQGVRSETDEALPSN